VMRQIRHPLVRRDVEEIFEHVLATTQGDLDAAERRLDDIDALLAAIAANPTSGFRLEGPLGGWIVRHGGMGRMITVVFRPDVGMRILYIGMIAFGGRNWPVEAEERRGFDIG